MKKTHGIFLAMTIVSAALFTATTASAWSIRRAGAACTGGGNAGMNPSSTNGLILYCAMPDEDDLPHQNITHLNIHMDIPSGNASAVRCITYFNATGGNCGTPQVLSGPGTKMFNPPNAPASFATDWNNGGHFAYLNIVVGTNGWLKGFYADNI
jgi:hypothetical protein